VEGDLIDEIGTRYVGLPFGARRLSSFRGVCVWERGGDLDHGLREGEVSAYVWRSPETAMLKSGVALRGVLPLEICNGSSCQLESSRTLEISRDARYPRSTVRNLHLLSQSHLSQTLKVIPPAGWRVLRRRLVSEI